MTLAFDFVPYETWIHVPVEYPPARALADRHYSRQTIGAEGILPPGERFLFWHEDLDENLQRRPDLAAAWGVVRNRFRGVWRFRNSLFRNESRTLSSTLIADATRTTYDCWLRRYHAIPTERLTTEVDIEATRARRGKRNPPGYCYLMAGWEHLYDLEPGHGRPARAVFGAPPP